VAKKLASKLRAVRTTSEDEKLVMELRTKMEPRQGPVNFTLLVRMGLRKLAEAEGLR
jgi:hypothetical protein